MNSLVILFVVVVIQLNSGETDYRSGPVPQCPSLEEVEAEVSEIPGVTHWGLRCGPVFMVPLPGEGA
ncbi:hypothetical protein [Algihabitans albus]|uniref:hypothetical protein n=1 Tax=Algihabitans albus TaxID=2164067 RepID=UPI0013C322A3|nr:hypothetical protein [Algihabitans albus]